MMPTATSSTNKSSKKGDRKKGKIRACTECHRTKNKCSYPEHQRGVKSPRCVRCIRLNKECIPHLSRQGKRKPSHTPTQEDGGGAENIGNRRESGPNKAAAVGGAGPPTPSPGASISGLGNATDHSQQKIDNNNNNSLNLNLFLAEQQQHRVYLNQHNDPSQGKASTSATSTTSESLAATQEKVSSPKRVTSSDSLNALLSRALSENSHNNLIGDSTIGVNTRDYTLNNSIPMPSQHPRERTSSSVPLNMLLSRALSDNNALIGDGSGSGCGKNANNNNLAMGGLLSQTTNLLSNLDPTKLNMMISHLANSNNINGVGISSNSNENTMGNHLGFSNNANTGEASQSSSLGNNNMEAGDAGQPPVSALLMLAGTSSSSGKASAVKDNNNGLQNLNIALNHFNANNNNNGSNNNGGAAISSNINNIMGGFNLGGSTSNSLGHVHPPQSSLFPGLVSASAEEVGRGSSMPLAIGNDTNSNQNKTENNSNSNSRHHRRGANSALQDTGLESLLKKQKKAHLLPSALNDNDNASMKFNRPAHLPYPRISLLPQNPANKNGTNSNNHITTSSNKNNNSGSHTFSHQRDSSHGTLSSNRSSPASNLLFATPEDAIGNAIARACAKHFGKKLTSLKNHYGLQCQIREWISMALVRRSFALLGKASALANRCGIHMDRILCGVADHDDDDDNDETTSATEGLTNSNQNDETTTATEGMTNSNQNSNDSKNIMGKRMNYLLAALLEPRSHQTLPVNQRRMLTPRLPQVFLNAVGCASCPTFDKKGVRNRWIIMRETHKGVSKFYCSPAFERNVLSWVHVSQIYEDNLADIHSLIFVKDDFRKFLVCNAHQISLHYIEGMPPRPVHAPKTKIRLLGRQWGKLAKHGKITKEMIQKVQNGDAMTLEMDLRFLSFPTMDKTTYYLEFFHHSCNDGSSSTESAPALWTRNLSNDSLDTKMVDGSAAASTQQSSARPSNSNDTSNNNPASATTERIVSESPAKDEDPPSLDELNDSEEWVGINDILASGDIDHLITAFLD